LKDGLSRFYPTIDFGQHVSERELLDAFRKTCQNIHDDPSPLGSGFALARSSRLASHRFRSGLVFTAMVRRLDVGMTT
jgi:hypothetical protein